MSLNMFDPPPCLDGYQATPKREGPVLPGLPDAGGAKELLGRLLGAGR